MGIIESFISVCKNLYVSLDDIITIDPGTGDILVVDRSEEAKHGKIVIAAIDGQLTVKRLHKSKSETYLLPENKDFEAIKETQEV